MKNYIHFFLLVFSAISINAQNTDSELIIGKWHNYDKTEIIKITKSKNNFVGHIIWMKNSKDKSGNLKLDNKNPNKELRTQPILNSQNIFGLQYENGKWINGKMYSHKKGGTVKFKIISISEKKLVINIYDDFFSKEIPFTRVK
jgi:hypothetical protein